uniref:Fibrinogen C-terminal domain-containing protein n=1 Tax=Biomphalaria glabrata TaxID=6526 RepID=A0A2C9KAH5_BIOGL
MATFLHLAICLSLFPISSTELVIDVQPNVILPEITPHLVINCSITNNQVQQLDLIKSLTLSRYNETSKEFQEMLTLDALPLILKLPTELNDSQIRFGNLYVTLTLHKPTLYDANVYRCNATGENANRTKKTVLAKKTVEFETNSTVLMEEMRRLKKNDNKCLCPLKKEERSDVIQRSRIQFYESSEIIKEQLEPLTLTCVYKLSNQDSNETSRLQSLFILHETNGVIAYINKGQPVVTTTKGENSKNVEGQIYDSELKESYLQVTWNNLIFSESGRYICEAYVKHSDGSYDKLKEILTITVKSPTVDDLAKVVHMLLTQLNKDVSLTRSINYVKEDSDSNKENGKSKKEDRDTVKQNIRDFQEYPKLSVANISTSIVEVKIPTDTDVDKIHQKGNTAPKSCRYVHSSDRRVIVTLASGLTVMCDTQTDGGGWIVFQRRVNGMLHFYRNWTEYRDGFFDYDIGEFYLGNENISRLTSTGQHELRIDLEFNKTTYFAHYNGFKVLGESEKYKVMVGVYSGNATDSFKISNNMSFTTFDRDNDNIAFEQCARYNKGAWWYDKCVESNLNGLWNKTSYEGMNWKYLTGLSLSVTFSEMKIRERLKPIY